MKPASRRILVVGGVSAGPSAAAKAARIDPEAEIVLFEQGPDVSYGVCELPYYFSRELESLDELVVHSPASLEEKKGFRVHTRHRVERIFPAQRTIEVHDIPNGISRLEHYNSLILATGCRPRRLEVFPSDAANVFYLKTLADARTLDEYMQQTTVRRICVIGGGFVGLEAAEAFRTRGCEIDIVSDVPLPHPSLEDETAALLGEILLRNGIAFHGGQTVLRAVMQEKTVVEAVTASNRFTADAYLVAIGLIPNVEIARNAGIRTGADGGILTDHRRMTNLDGIYAAGDCSEVRDFVTNASMLLPFASVANRTGRVAGENAAGGSASFKGAVPLSALHVFGHEIVTVGLPVREMKRRGVPVVTERVVSSSRVDFMPDAQSIFVQLAADRRSRKLLGANLLAKEHAAQRANVIALAIRKGMTVHEFLEADFIYTPRLAPLRDPLLICAQRLENALR